MKPGALAKAIRLSSGGPPKAMITTETPAESTYPSTTSPRSRVLPNRPLGYERNTWR